jgi:hypothetical protein
VVVVFLLLLNLLDLLLESPHGSGSNQTMMMMMMTMMIMSILDLLLWLSFSASCMLYAETRENPHAQFVLSKNKKNMVKRMNQQRHNRQYDAISSMSPPQRRTTAVTFASFLHSFYYSCSILRRSKEHQLQAKNIDPIYAKAKVINTALCQQEASSIDACSTRATTSWSSSSYSPPILSIHHPL